MADHSYSDIARAVRGEKIRIWFAWLCGGIIWLIVTKATMNIHIVSVITQVLLVVVLGVLSTVAAVTMTRRLNRRVAAARKDVLGDV